MADPEISRLRAGFWRRAFALAIDLFILMTLIQIFVSALFWLTDGALQFHGGTTFKDCRHPVRISDVPPGLLPPPPRNPTAAYICHTYFFVFPTARNLMVERKTKEGHLTTTVWTSYPLSPENRVRQAFSMDNYALALAFLYLIVSEYRFGRTVGKKLLHVRVVDTLYPGRVGIPLRSAIVRNIFLWAGFSFMAAVYYAFYVINGGDVEAMAQGHLFTGLVLSAIFLLAWTSWIVVQILRKQDPVYDVIAGTTVLSG